ncbi:MAG: SUMF1/EgtB/PvdO family nonheme iron enzyme [Cyanobacteria bacterium P01_F01_bin.150]
MTERRTSHPLRSDVECSQKRGGSWINDPSNSRSAYRNHNTRANRNNNLGFRVVLSSSLALPKVRIGGRDSIERT